MSKAIGLIIFTAGAAIGSVTAWYIAKKKYEQIAQEEIDSVKEVFSRRYKKDDTSIDPEKSDSITDDTVNDVMEYARKLSENDYTDYSSNNENKSENVEKPYVISPDEFGEIEDYEKLSITYYADQILADDNDEWIEDVESIVGFESLSHFGEYEDDSVFVRNDRLKCDYEILLDNRAYSDVIKEKPYLRGD